MKELNSTCNTTNIIITTFNNFYIVIIMSKGEILVIQFRPMDLLQLILIMIGVPACE